MADRPEPSEPDPTDSAGKLPSARATAGGDRGSQPDRGKPRGDGRRGKRGGRTRRPTPARTLTGTEPDPGPEPDASHVSLDIDGEIWTARVLGRAGGSKDGATPLILIGFWGQGSPDAPPDREALVVGRSLAQLTASDLEASFLRSAPPRSEVRTGGFFQGAGERTGRG